MYGNDPTGGKGTGELGGGGGGSLPIAAPVAQAMLVDASRPSQNGSMYEIELGQAQPTAGATGAAAGTTSTPGRGM